MPDNEVLTQPMNLPSAIRRIGRTGLKSYMGIIHEQELPQLQNVLVRMRIFREMRLDPTIGILEQAITRVLLAADFSTTPAGNTPEDKYAAELLWDIMNNMDTEWYEHVEDALEHLWFGFAITQMVMKFRKDGNIGLADLMPMAQEMTFRWGRQDGSGKVSGIEMLDPVTGTIYRVPSEKFLHFTDRGRKRNPEGEGMCLHVWRSWRYKTNLQEIEAIGIERDMGGMPVFKIPDKPSEQEKQDIMEQARAMRADENAGLIVYGDQEVHPYETEGKMYDVRKVIEDYAWDILAYSGAQWLKLGQDNGTQALVQGTTDMFGLYLRAIQERMLSVWHKQMIPTLAMFNPKLTTPNGTPKITWADPGVPDVKAILEAFASGVNSGVITPTRSDEVHIRSILDLPELPKDMGQDSRVPNIGQDLLSTRIADLQNREQPAAMLMEAAANKFKSFTFSKADYSDGFMRLPLAGFDGPVEIELVDGQYIRQNLYQDFTEGGNDLAFDGIRVPFKMPANHIWIDFDVNSSEVMGVIGHELAERAEMIKRIHGAIQNGGKRPDVGEIQAIYEECHDIANGIESDINSHPESATDRIRELMAEQPKSISTFEGFKEDEHPRGKEGTSEGGQFVPKGGGEGTPTKDASKYPTVESFLKDHGYKATDDFRNNPEEFANALLKGIKKGKPGISKDKFEGGQPGYIFRDDTGKAVGILKHNGKAMTDLAVSKDSRHQGIAWQLLQAARKDGILENKGPFTKESAALLNKELTNIWNEAHKEANA